MRLCAGDNVVIISGKDKGKTGSILRVLSTGRVVVGDINMRTKHVRAQPNRPGQIVKYEASIDISNVMLLDPKTKKRTRVGYSITEKGKARIAKRSGQAITKAAPSSKKSTKEAPAKKEEEKPALSSSGKKDTTKAQPKITAKKASGKVDAPQKSPFWKRMGFGAEAIEEGSTDEAQQNQKDHGVPEQGKTPDNFSHQRGK